MGGGWGTPSWMGGEPSGGETFVSETFVNGKDRETARRLLAAAESLGLDSIVVRTARGGFIVPDEVWDAAQQHDPDGTEPF